MHNVAAVLKLHTKFNYILCVRYLHLKSVLSIIQLLVKLNVENTFPSIAT